MALTKVVYTDETTLIEAQNLNDIQDAILDLEDVPVVRGLIVNTTADNIDLDNLTTSFRYINGTAAHTPSGFTGYAYVLTYKETVASRGIQFFYPYAEATKMWFYRKYTSGWGAWKCNGYVSGDTVNISPNTLQFSGIAVSKKVVRFTIPLTREIFASNVAVSGSLGIRCNGTWSDTFAITAATQECYVSPCGVNVILTFSTDQSYLTVNHVIAIQPSSMVLTFS